MTNKITITATVLRNKEIEAHREFTTKTSHATFRTQSNHKELVPFNQLLSLNKLLRKNKVTVNL